MITKDEMLSLYTVKRFFIEQVLVERKSDGVIGTLDFDHFPHLYYNFQEA